MNTTLSNDLFLVELVSSFEITSRVESSHLPVSVYAHANHNTREAVNRKGNAEYSERERGGGETERQRQRHRHTDRGGNRQVERDRHTERHTHRQTDRNGQAERETERERDRVNFTRI